MAPSMIAATAFLIVLLFWIVSTRRSLLMMDEIVSNAMTQVVVHLSSCWDALCVLMDAAREYENEYEILKETVLGRCAIDKGSAPGEVTSQETLIHDYLRKIKTFAERTALKENSDYNKAVDSIALCENKLRSSRMQYNNSVTKFNRFIRLFPTFLIAGMLGFQKREYLEAAADTDSQI